MHKTQQKILDLSAKHNLAKLSYRKIGELLGGEHPQTVKYHLKKIEELGLLKTSSSFDFLKDFVDDLAQQPNLIEIPVLGLADCGIATTIAEQRIDNYLQVSERIISRYRSVFALKAKGNSMNNASINGKNIEEGDYALVDYSNRNPKNGDYIVSIINDCANIKIFYFDEESNQVQLISKSKKEYPPIIIDGSDPFSISGKVFDVIKTRA